MSTVKANNHQIGQSGTATNNFTLYQPSTPDGTVRLAVGNSGATTGDVLSVSNTGLSVTGTLSATGNISFDGGTFVFNESGADKDFRIEGDTDANLFFTDASTDRVGIGTSSPAYKLDVQDSNANIAQFTSSGASTSLRINNTNANAWGSNIGIFTGGTAAGYFGTIGSLLGNTTQDLAVYATANNGFRVYTNGNNLRATFDSSGNLGLGVTPSAWYSAFKAFQVGNASVYGAVGGGYFSIGSNFYTGSDTTLRYISSTYARQFTADSAGFTFNLAPFGIAGATTSITSGQVYTVTTLGSTTLGQWQAYFSALSAIPSVGQSITATATGTLAGGATVTQTITFTQAMTLDASGNLGVGTTSPATRLDVSQANAKSATGIWQTQIFDSTSQTTGVGGGISFGGYKTAQSASEVFAGIDAYKENSTAGNAAGALRFHTQVSGGSGLVERVRIGSGGEVYFPGVGTTASAANAYLNNGSTPANQLLRSTSSLRYKTDVETLDHAKADAVLNLRPVWYRSKAEADRKDWSWYGLIAEEVAQVEARLVHWSYPEDQFETIETQTEIEKTREVEVTPAVLDDEGNVVEPAVTETETYTETETKSERKLKADAQLAPDGVQYDRLTVMLLDIVKRQNQRIEQLEAKVAALEAQ